MATRKRTLFRKELRSLLAGRKPKAYLPFDFLTWIASKPHDERQKFVLEMLQTDKHGTLEECVHAWGNTQAEVVIAAIHGPEPTYGHMPRWPGMMNEVKVAELVTAFILTGEQLHAA